MHHFNTPHNNTSHNKNITQVYSTSDANGIGMDAWTPKRCCDAHCNGACVGKEAGARNLVFFRVKWLQPAMKVSSSKVVAAGVALTCDWFLQGVLHCAIVRACVVIGCFGICGCRSQCNGCLIIVLFCCNIKFWQKMEPFTVITMFVERLAPQRKKSFGCQICRNDRHPKDTYDTLQSWGIHHSTKKRRSSIDICSTLQVSFYWHWIFCTYYKVSTLVTDDEIQDPHQNLRHHNTATYRIKEQKTEKDCMQWCTHIAGI